MASRVLPNWHAAKESNAKNWPYCTLRENSHQILCRGEIREPAGASVCVQNRGLNMQQLFPAISPRMLCVQPN
jgi:hypothetical protein